jgi:hypothetical protein
MYRKFIIRPLEHGVSTQYIDLFTPQGFSPFSNNVKIMQKSARKRWGYSLDRTLDSMVYDIALFQLTDGTRHTLYLTATDLCHREAGGSNTWSYLTDTYVTGTISNVTGKVITGSSTLWKTPLVLAAGDKFILDADETATIEPDTNWGTISTIDSDTQITLVDNYSGTTGAMTGTYKARKVYSVAVNNRWQHAIVGDKFCFGNGTTNVQYWNGTGYAADLNATNANKARYLIEYANRLCLADYFTGSTRFPLSFKYSKEGDPTDWVDSTAGEMDLLETDDYITGMGKVGSSIILYKRDGIIIGNRTGVATQPIVFPTQKKGIGLAAPYSLVEFLGTNAWVGRSDFYALDGEEPTPIGDWVRNIFFDIVPEAEVQNVWGFHNNLTNELMWKANTIDGPFLFVFNYKEKEWYIYQFYNDMSAAGRGAI